MSGCSGFLLGFLTDAPDASVARRQKRTIVARAIAFSHVAELSARERNLKLALEMLRNKHLAQSLWCIALATRSAARAPWWAGLIYGER